MKRLIRILTDSVDLIELNHNWEIDSPKLELAPPYNISLAQSHSSTALPGISFAVDQMEFSGQHGAPTIDAIGHVSNDGILFGGVPASEAEGPNGLTKLGIEEYPVDKLVNRAVLLDIARYKSEASLSAGYEITVEDIIETARIQNVEILPGDAVLIRTGYGQFFVNDKARYSEYLPGIGPSAAIYLASLDIFLTGSDTMTYEVQPQSDITAPVHRILLAEYGIYIVENLNLEDIADELSEREVYEFVLVLNPPRIRGATGFAVNAFAIIPERR